MRGKRAHLVYDVQPTHVRAVPGIFSQPRGKISHPGETPDLGGWGANRKFYLVPTTFLVPTTLQKVVGYVCTTFQSVGIYHHHFVWWRRAYIHLSSIIQHQKSNINGNTRIIKRVNKIFIKSLNVSTTNNLQKGLSKIAKQYAPSESWQYWPSIYAIYYQ